jgi:hypothetical protein
LHLGVELAEEVDFATSSTWQLGPSLLDPEAADFNAWISPTIVADDHHHETMKFDMSFSTNEYDIDTDRLSVATTTTTTCTAALITSQIGLTVFPWPGDDRQELQDFAAAILVD